MCWSVRSSVTASPSSACAAGTGGSIQSSSSPANAGERRASGSTAAQTSWRKPGQRQLGGATAAADGLRSLVHGHLEAGLRELHRACEPFGPAPIDDRALHRASRVQASSCLIGSR